MQRNMMCRTLAGLAGMIVFTVNLCGAEYDFTKGTLPRGVIGTDRQLLKDRRLDNYLPQFRIVVDEDVKNKDTFTISVWFAPNKRIRNSAPEALVFGKTPFAPENNLGFFFGLNKTRLEFKWWNHQSCKYNGICSRGDYLPEANQISPVENRWNLAVAVVEPSSVKLYLNGVLTADLPLSHTVKICDDTLNLGFAQFGTRFANLFRGAFAKVSITRKVLSGTEIKKIWSSESLKDCKPLPEIRHPDFDPDFKKVLPRTAAYAKNISRTAGSMGSTVANITFSQGEAQLFIDGKQVNPMMFMPRPAALWPSAEKSNYEAIKDFSAAGITLFSTMLSTNNRNSKIGNWWLEEGKYDFAAVDEHIRSIVKVSPNAKILLRIKLDTPWWWWLRKNPQFISVGWDMNQKRYRSSKYWCGLTSPEWTQSYSRMLRDLITHIEQSDYAGHVVGYLPAGGAASEWYYHGTDIGLTDYSEIAHRDFAHAMERKYRTVTALNRTWGVQLKSFSEVKVPSPELRLCRDYGLFRDMRKARPVLDYLDFLNNITVSSVKNAAGIVKELTHGRKLVGFFYGYQMLQRYSGSGSLLNSGHSALSGILRDKNVDFICTPTDYGKRKGGESGIHIGNFNGSFALHRKMFWDEADYRTHLVADFDFVTIPSESENIEVFRRTAGYMLTKGTGVWWFALTGDQQFHTETIMNEIARLQELGRKFLSVSRKAPADIALIYDEPSYKSICWSERATAFLQPAVFGTVQNLHHSGLAGDIYLSDDLDNPEMKDYKLYIFLNQFLSDPEKTECIHRKLRRNNASAIWVYAPGYVTEQGVSLDSMKQLTGLDFVKKSDFPVFHTPGLNSMQFKDVNGFRSAYSPGGISKEQIRKAAQAAGIHVWIDSGDVFYPGESFLMLHTSSAGTKRIRLPRKAVKVTELLSGEKVAENTTEFTMELPEKVTRIFYLEY